MESGAKWCMCVSSGDVQTGWVAIATLVDSGPQTLTIEGSEIEFVNRHFELHANHESNFDFR